MSPHDSISLVATAPALAAASRPKGTRREGRKADLHGVLSRHGGEQMRVDAALRSAQITHSARSTHEA
jgi:hypothetical protein